MKKKVSGPGAGELPGRPSAPETGEAVSAPGGSCKLRAERPLCRPAPCTLTRRPDAPPPSSHFPPSGEVTQTSQASMYGRTYRGSKKSRAWQELQNAHSPMHAPHFLPKEELSFCFGFLVTSISCDHYLNVIEHIYYNLGIVMGVEYEGLGPQRPWSTPQKVSNFHPPTHVQPNDIISENQWHS